MYIQNLHRNMMDLDEIFTDIIIEYSKYAPPPPLVLCTVAAVVASPPLLSVVIKGGIPVVPRIVPFIMLIIVVP